MRECSIPKSHLAKKQANNSSINFIPNPIQGVVEGAKKLFSKFRTCSRFPSCHAYHLTRTWTFVGRVEEHHTLTVESHSSHLPTQDEQFDRYQKMLGKASWCQRRNFNLIILTRSKAIHELRVRRRQLRMQKT